MVGVLSEAQLKRIAKHKYNACCTTILDPYMQVWWRWFVLRLPLWIAPNALTIFGLLTNLSTTLVLTYFSPQARSEVPFWSLYLNAFGLFVYQTLDAVDGKQARRTGSSSPLGELFDHGCDAISMVVVVTGGAIAMKLGQLPECMMVLGVGAAFIFYLTHWIAYVTGTVRFGKIDVTEIQISGMLLFFVSGFCGQSIFLERAPFIDLEIRVVIVALVTISTALIVVVGIYEIIQGGVGKNGSSIADTSVLSPAVPMGFSIYFCYYSYAYSNINVFARAPCLFNFTYGIVLAKISILLLVASLSKSPIPKLDTIMICPVLQVVNIHFASPMSEYRLLWFSLIFSFFNLMQYCHVVISEICEYLNISCFRITVKKIEEETATKEFKSS